jgi:hypothetical protein
VPAARAAPAAAASRAELLTRRPQRPFPYRFAAHWRGTPLP